MRYNLILLISTLLGFAYAQSNIIEIKSATRWEYLSQLSQFVRDESKSLDSILQQNGIIYSKTTGERRSTAYFSEANIKGYLLGIVSGGYAEVFKFLGLTSDNGDFVDVLRHSSQTDQSDCDVTIGKLERHAVVPAGQRRDVSFTTSIAIATANTFKLGVTYEGVNVGADFATTITKTDSKTIALYFKAKDNSTCTVISAYPVVRCTNVQNIVKTYNRDNVVVMEGVKTVDMPILAADGSQLDITQCVDGNFDLLTPMPYGRMKKPELPVRWTNIKTQVVKDNKVIKTETY